jgi:hypothetical protein
LKTVEIPGGKATLRELDDMTVGQRRAVQRAMFAAGPVIKKLPKNWEKLTEEQQKEVVIELSLTPGESDTLDALQDSAILASLDGWTLPEPAPKSPDELSSMKGNIYDALSEATKTIGVDIAKSSFEPNPDQKSPTGPSSS